MGIEKIASKLPVFKSIGKASSLNASKLSKSIFSKTPKLIKFELKPAKTRAVRSTSGGGGDFPARGEILNGHDEQKRYNCIGRRLWIKKTKINQRIV